MKKKHKKKERRKKERDFKRKGQKKREGKRRKDEKRVKKKEGSKGHRHILSIADRIDLLAKALCGCGVTYYYVSDSPGDDV